MLAALAFAACGQDPADRSASVDAVPTADTLVAVEDFERLDVDGFVPVYRDVNNGVLAVNSVEYPDRFGAAETQWDGATGAYDVSIATMPEEDGESTYRLFVNGTIVGEFTNPEETRPFGYAAHTWEDVELASGDTIRIASVPHSNRQIPEGDGYAFARGRWQHLVLAPAQ